MTFQWFLGTNAILVTTNSAFCLTNVQPSQAGTYSAVVTNIYGAATSAPAVLAVSAEPIIGGFTTNQQVMAGDTVSFSVVVTGWMPMTYQWFPGTNAVLVTTNSVLCLTNIQPSQAGSYKVVVTNVYGAATSAPAMLTVTGAPVILVSPADQSFWPDDRANFSVVAVGALPMTYQWFFGTNEILQATNSTLQLTNVYPRQIGAYTVVVTNIYGAVTSAPAMLAFSVTVTNCTEASLRAAMAGGGAVTFACDGMINLGDTIPISDNTILDGTGHQIIINGGGGRRVFVVGANGTLTLNHLTIEDGGIFNAGGAVNLNGVTFYGNSASNGGAIYNAGQMNVESCCFTNNHAWANSACFGGAIYNVGSMNLDLCQIGGNSAGDALYSMPSYEGSGGAIYNSGQLTIDRTTLNANTASGGNGYNGASDYYTMNGYPGGSGANAFGGGIYNVSSLTISRSTLCGNIAKGGDGGWGGYGIQFADIGGSGGDGGNGATGMGGALFSSGSAVLVNCTIVLNSARGGSGGHGGDGYGHITGQSGHGGNGGNGGNGIGGCVSGSCSFINCTILGNSSVAGSAGGAGAGSFGNPIPGASGSAYGGGEGGPNTLCFSNTPGGNNTFANPQLGPLADNGGPTLTMALLPGSPAIDAGSAVGAPATDQRGIPRPQGAGVDIGAFEYLSSPIFTGATMLNATNRQLQLCGLSPNQTLTLQVSTNLLNWWDATNFTAGSNGVFQCVDPIPGDGQLRFYRLKSGIP